MCFTCAAWSSAQEEPPTPKKPVTKAAGNAKAKDKENMRKRRIKAEIEARARAVDINRASKEELKKLRGITDAHADAIIAKRPYKTKADLVVKNAIPGWLYQSLRKQVAAK